MRFSIITVSFFLAILFLTHSLLVVGKCPEQVPAEFSHVKPGKIVAAYFASWDKYGSYSIVDIEQIADKLTHLIYAFAKPNSITGKCDLHDPWADVGANFEHRKKVGGHFGQLLQLKQKYPHLKILLSIGGGTYSKNLLEIAEQSMSKTFVKSAVGLLDAYEYEYEHSRYGSTLEHRFEYPDLFDGIDLDWEWTGSNPSEQQVAAYHSMVQMFASELKKRSRRQGKKSLLTCAVQVRSKLIETLDFASLAPVVDWFHVMAYDFGGSSASGVSFNAPICNQWSSYSIDSAIHVLMQQGVSPAKLVLGIPLYGHVYDQADEKIGSSFVKTEKTGALQYGQIKQLYLDNPDCYTKWHSKSQVPYAYCPLDNIFVSYDDERSIAAKVAYARQKLLQGIVFWRLSGDDKDHSLIKAVKM